MNGEQPGEKLSDEAMPGEELFGKDAQNLRPRLTTGYPKRDRYQYGLTLRT